VVLIVFFLAPYALLMVELGSSFTQEGGPYEWMKLSWGRLAAGIGAVLYWVTNPFWVGGSLCFTATDATCPTRSSRVARSPRSPTASPSSAS
jgi:glutamate:GABA antiporter